jgi:hypothetical protein
MGLRLLARYYERNEAYIAFGALEAAGVVAFLENPAQSSVTPFEEIARGGYRLMVPDEELEAAIAVMEEARRDRSFEGERLSQRTYIALSLVLMFTIGMFMPFRTSTWHEVHGERDRA